MGFLSFNLNFYRNELKMLESRQAEQTDIYRAIQLLRMLDDLSDEGYTELNVLLENEIRGVSRLREYISSNGADPFSISAGNRMNAETFLYSEQETELNQAIIRSVNTAQELTDTSVSPFAEKLRSFCRWIGYEYDTAYIFLLRDTLLPFVYYFQRGRKHIYPWLLGRRSLAELTGKQNADDEIRASVYRALESECTDCKSFFEFVLPDIRNTIAAYPRAKNTLCTMLKSICTKKIIVVESGCAGTFPLLLASLDPRVDMRMYTTYPYLRDIYGTRIFTARYEENRMFETMASQELYFRFSGTRDGRFYVRECTDEKTRRQSLHEIRMMK